jgi:hypothetical protein
MDAKRISNKGAAPTTRREQSKLADEYIASLTEKEQKAYHIAKGHLASSFELTKSVGFIQWLAKQHVSSCPQPPLPP